MIGEGFELIEVFNFDVDYECLIKVWNSGFIIEFVFVGYIGNVFSKDVKLSEI